MTSKDFLAWFDKTYASRADAEAVALKAVVQQHRAQIEAAKDLEEAKKIAEKYALDQRQPDLVNAWDKAVTEFKEYADSQAKTEEKKARASQSLPEQHHAASTSAWPSRLGMAAVLSFFLFVAAILGYAVVDDDLMDKLADTPLPAA